MSRADPATAKDSLTAALPGWLLISFMVTLVVPILLPAGPFTLSPHRLFLILMFVPMVGLLFMERAGTVRAIDWLMIGSALWAVLSFMANHPISRAIEPAGIYVVESLGAYMLGRLAVRNRDDFLLLVKTMFLICLFLLPFALIEGLTGRNILLSAIPRSIGEVNIGERLGIHRVQSVFSHPILFGAFVSTGLGLFWYAQRPLAGFAGRIPTGILPVVATFFSMSTGALIALVVQFVLIGWELVMRTVKTRWRIFAWGTVATYILLEFVTEVSPFHTLVRYASLNQGSAYNRILIFNYGMDNVWANPVFGLGLRDWVRPGFMGSSVDNFWLLTAMRHGVPAFLMMAAAIYLLIRKTAMVELSDPKAAACRAAFLTSLGGLIVAGGTVHYWHTMFSFVLFFIGSGVWIMDQDKAEEATQTQEDSVPSPAAGTPYSRFPPKPAASARRLGASTPASAAIRARSPRS